MCIRDSLTAALFPPNRYLFRESVPSSHLYFVVSGSLVATVGTSSGDVSLGVVRPGSWIGEIGFIDGGLATATVKAGEATRVLEISHAELASLQQNHPRAAAVLMRTVTMQLAQRLRASTRGIIEEVAEGRYRLRQPEENRGWLAHAMGWLVGSEGIE